MSRLGAKWVKGDGRGSQVTWNMDKWWMLNELVPIDVLALGAHVNIRWSGCLKKHHYLYLIEDLQNALKSARELIVGFVKFGRLSGQALSTYEFSWGSELG